MSIDPNAVSMTDESTSFRDEPLPREELLELAAADAFGALDAVEQARFERAFALSAPSLQAEVRTVQDRVAQDPAFRSGDQPPASLRLKTLARVAAAIESEGVAPIAVIGPARGAGHWGAGHWGAGHWGAGHWGAGRRGAGRRAEPAVDSSRDALLREILARAEIERRPPQHLWRIAALFLFAALVVALFFNSEQRKISERLMDYVDGRMTETSVRALAQATESFDFTRARSLQVLDADGRASRTVHAYLDEVTREVCVVGFGVVDPGLSVRVLDGASGATHQLAASVVESRGFGLRFQQPEGVRELRLEVGDSALRIII
jgi:hypothetical protein